MYEIIWLEEAKADLDFWVKKDQIIIKRIKLLLENLATTPEYGIGKPEKLKHKFSGYFSRRINLEHRLIYKVLHDTKQVWIISCKGHYQNN